MLSCGKGVFEVSGYAEGDIMGKPLVDAFGLSGFPDDKDPCRSSSNGASESSTST